MNALEQSFADLCAKHGLEALSVEFHATQSGGEWFTSYAHAGRICASGSGEKLADAVVNALTAIDAKRGFSALADEPLTEMAA